MNKKQFVLGLSLLAVSANCGEEPSEWMSAGAIQTQHQFQVPSGFQTSLWARETQLANPVQFSMDERGRLFVAETHRLNEGTPDIRLHRDWLEEDLACRKVEDRMELIRRHLGESLEGYTKKSERIRILEDTDGDGRADRSDIMAEGFNSVEDGLAAGILASRGHVYLACIPNVWWFCEKDGVEKERRSLHHGYGVHIGYIGHDLHGFRVGPDGKIYFSIGDRGLHVETEGRVISLPDTGGVLRMNPDGSDLELFAQGLRNPQDIAFDSYGNLFAADNNADSGDKARWVYVVEGGDSGWRLGYQFIQSPVSRGPWNREKLWHLATTEQPAYLVPPVAHIADGPSGVAYYPGTGFSDRYQDHFFLSDFIGGGTYSGIWSFVMRPKGASFEMVDRHRFLWGVLPTDIEFGPDGALYVADWMEGWDMTGQGRIWRVRDSRADPVTQVQSLLRSGMAELSTAELLFFLRHGNGRVRLASQFALVEKVTGQHPFPTGTGIWDPKALEAIVDTAKESSSFFARLHALWAIGQIGREKPLERELASLLFLTTDRNEEVKAQAAKLFGELNYGPAADSLISLLENETNRVRFFAAMSLGKLGRAEAIAPLYKMLIRNNDQDLFLRHAGVMALSLLGRNHALPPAEGVALKRAVVAALRKLGSSKIARYLGDGDIFVLEEAARAILDAPIDSALSDLAAVPIQGQYPESLAFRILSANFRLGLAENAERIARWALQRELAESIRVEAVELLGLWVHPPNRDRITGLWRTLPTREPAIASAQLRRIFPKILAGNSDSMKMAAVHAVGKLSLKDLTPHLFGILKDLNTDTRVRIESLKALHALRQIDLKNAMDVALSDPQIELRVEALRLLLVLEANEAMEVLERNLESKEIMEKQASLVVLGEIKNARSIAIVSRWMDKLLAGDLPSETQREIEFDLIETARKLDQPELREKLAKFDGQRSSGVLGRYQEVIYGGNAAKGRRVFCENEGVSCLRCHRIAGQGGEVGPDLSDIGSRETRESILESIAEPNSKITKGFETLVLALSSGEIVTGILKEESYDRLRLVTAEGKSFSVLKKDIEESRHGNSAMPFDIVKHLSKRELRDLIAYLASVKR